MRALTKIKVGRRAMVKFRVVPKNGITLFTCATTRTPKHTPSTRILLFARILRGHCADVVRTLYGRCADITRAQRVSFATVRQRCANIPDVAHTVNSDVAQTAMNVPRTLRDRSRTIRATSMTLARSSSPNFQNWLVVGAQPAGPRT